MKSVWISLLVSGAGLVASELGEPVAFIRINGAISPATAGYVSRSIGEATGISTGTWPATAGGNATPTA